MDRAKGRAGLVPLAVVLAVVLAAVLARVGSRPPARAGAAEAPRAGGRAAPQGALSALDGALEPDLRGVRPSPDAGAVLAASEGARLLHGDARRTHRARGEGPRTVRTAWTVDVGGPVEAQVVASPDGQTLYAATLEGALWALARADGEKKWRLDLGGRAYATPCVAADGTIYAGSDAKKLRAVTPAGATLWSLETDGEADTAPLVTSDGSVVFAAGRTVYSVHKGGDVAWRFEARGKVFAAPALAGPLVIVGAQDHHVYALRAASGQLAWSVDLGADVDGGPAIGDGGEIFVGTDRDEIVRLSDAGAIVWRTNVGGYVRGPLAVARNGDVLAGVYGPTPREVRLDGAGGAVRGAFSVQGTGARELGVHGGASEDDRGALFFGAQDDMVYAIGPEGGTMWSFAAQGDVDAPVTLLPGGAVAFGSDDGKVYLLSAP